MHKSSALIIAFISLALAVQAQISLSPYSRYGIGDLHNPGSTRNFAMGSIGIGAYDAATINRINPASYADIRLTTLEVNGFGVYSMQKSNFNTQNLGTAGFHNASLAFSNKRGFGIVAGLAPYSAAGYDVIVGDSVQTDSSMQYYTTTYGSDGGLNQFYIGFGVRLFRRVFFGTNFVYAFGTISRTWNNDFVDNTLNEVNIERRSTLRGFIPQIGVQYSDTLTLRTTVDRAKFTRQEIAQIDKEIAEVKKERESLAKDAEKLKEWEAGENAKIEAIEKEKEELEAQIEKLSENEEANQKEIGKLQDKLFRREKKRKKRQREIRARNREMRDEKARVDSKLKKLNSRKEAKEGLIREIEAGKQEVTTERKRRFLLRLGGTFDPPTKLSGNSRVILDNQIAADTLVDIEGNATLPMKYGFGFSLARANRWMVGVDATVQDWSTFTFFDESSELKRAFKVNAGGEWIPDLLSINYMNRVAYRAGGYYQSTFLTIDDTPINEYGLSFGVGLPIGRFNAYSATFSRVNLGVSIGRRGTLSNDLLEETTFRFRVGVNLNDVWFIRRVID